MRMSLASAIWRAGAIAFCWTGLLCAQPAASQEVRLNEVLRSLFYTPEYVAVRTGAFAQEGLNIVGPKTTWGMQATVTEVVSGNSNIALMGPEAAGLTQEASPDRRLVNFALLKRRRRIHPLQIREAPLLDRRPAREYDRHLGQGFNACSCSRRPH